MPSSYIDLPSSGPLSYLDLRETFGGPAQGTPGGLQSYSVPGCYTYVVPNSTSSIQVLLIGGGGAGAAGSCTFYAPGGSGGGGGGGAVSYSSGYPVTPGSTLQIHVGAGGSANTCSHSGSGDATRISISCMTVINAPGGSGGYRSGIGGSSGGGIHSGGCRITNISTSTTSTQSHSAGGGGGAGGNGGCGLGRWAACCSGHAGDGGAGESRTIFGQTFTGGIGGGGGAPFVKLGTLRGSSSGGGTGGYVSGNGHEGLDGFGTGGGGGGAGGIILTSATATIFVGYICGTHLYVQGVNNSLTLQVGAQLQFTPGINSPVHTGTVITSKVYGTGAIGGDTSIGSINVATYNTATAYGHFIVSPGQYAYEYNSTGTFYTNIQITAYYTGLEQGAIRGSSIAYGFGGKGGDGGAYIYALDVNGGPAPIDAYYRGGCYVPDIPENSNIPTSGAIVVPCDFYGARGSFVYYYCLPDGQFDTDFNLLDRAIAACPPYTNNGTPLIAYITINGTLGASSPTTYAYDPGSGWAVPPKVCISVGATGIISGAGAAFGSRNPDDAVGGDAMMLRYSTCINNNGIIQAGGGAGYPAGPGGSAGGAGYVAGTIGGTLFAGGPYISYTYPGGKKSKSSSTVVGGGGGGWVAECGKSPSVDGWGYGSDAYNNPHGGGAPGYAIINKSTYAVFNTVGTIRGLCNP